MIFFDNIKFDQINLNNLSAKFLKVREYFFTKNKISVFANKIFTCTLQLPYVTTLLLQTPQRLASCGRKWRWGGGGTDGYRQNSNKLQLVQKA